MYRLDARDLLLSIQQVTGVAGSVYPSKGVGDSMYINDSQRKFSKVSLQQRVDKRSGFSSIYPDVDVMPALIEVDLKGGWIGNCSLGWRSSLDFSCSFFRFSDWSRHE